MIDDDHQSLVTVQSVNSQSTAVSLQRQKAETRLPACFFQPDLPSFPRRCCYKILLFANHIFISSPTRSSSAAPTTTTTPTPTTTTTNSRPSGNRWSTSPYSHSKAIKVVAPSPMLATSVSPRSPSRASSEPVSRTITGSSLPPVLPSPSVAMKPALALASPK